MTSWDTSIVSGSRGIRRWAVHEVGSIKPVGYVRELHPGVFQYEWNGTSVGCYGTKGEAAQELVARWKELPWDHTLKVPDGRRFGVKQELPFGFDRITFRGDF